MKKTATGKDCLRWDTKPYVKPKDFSIAMLYEEHFLNEDVESAENYCRNPALREKPWCFVSDPNIKWEYCDISMCMDLVPLECKRTQKGAEYMGINNVTLMGLPCLPWLEYPLTGQYRSWSLRLPAFSDEVNKKHNYCRNPGGRPGGPWCYYGSNWDGAWSYCDVPFCPLQETKKNGNRKMKANYPECRKTKMGREYMGTIRKSETGKPCLYWERFLDLSKYPYGMVNYLPLTTRPEDKNLIRIILTSSLPRPQLNFCRNPGWGSRPWCFVSMTPTIEWEYCDVPFCDDLTAFNVYPKKPFCYVKTVPYVIWKREYCDIPYCYELLESISTIFNSMNRLAIADGGNKRDEYPHCLLTEMGTEYIGTMKKTKTGKDCLPWDSHSDKLIGPENHSIYDFYFATREPRYHKNYCRNPGPKDKPWCWVNDTTIQWEYCDIPSCDDMSKESL
ncbi:unnamed protein product, partial [Darwinula stevensoni]